MPIIKPISGHTNTQRIQAYLEKNGRALARDFYNLSWDEKEMKGYDPLLKDSVCWADEMDQLRAATGNDRSWGGRPARTFKHYVVSPDPKDHIGLDALREITCSWVTENFSEYQVAIIYHDDNAEHIPHAHVVVNNTNLVTGRRLQDPAPRELKQSIQDLAKQRGLHFLDNSPCDVDGFSKLAQKDQEPRIPNRTRQEVYMSRAERRVLESGEYSWVNDIRDRVAMAKNLARNEGEFRQILDMLDVDISDNSPKARREDWIYSLRDQSTKRVGGERLGYTFGKEALQSRFSRSSIACPSIDASKKFMALAMHATQLNNLEELHDLALSLEINARFGIAGISDYDRRIDGLEAQRKQTRTPQEKSKITAQISQLEHARAFVSEKALLPKVRPPKPKRERTPAQKKVAAQRNKSAFRSGKTRAISHSYDQPIRNTRSR